MVVLIIFATYSGGTETVAEKMVELLTRSGLTAKKIRADKVTEADLNAADAVIMGSPTWKVMGQQGMPHDYYFDLMKRINFDALQEKPFGVYALGDESYGLVCGAYIYLERFAKRLKGNLIIESLQIEGFYFNEQKNSEIISSWINNFTNELNL